MDILQRIWRLLSSGLKWHLLWLWHDKFMIGVSVCAFNSEQHVLLCRHRFWASGSWGLPSGYANKGETLESAVIREVEEELGLSLEVTKLLRLRSGFKLRIEATFLGHIQSGTPVPNRREILEAKYFDLNELPTGLLESHGELISLAQQHLK
jgi:8-oxo-dGTP diphosphatase